MTSLTRWNPFDDIANWWPRSLFSRDMMGALQPDGTVALEWSPRCDVSETDDAILVHAELPGVDTKDMEVSVREGVLTIRGEKRSEKKTEERGRTYTERFFGSFERRIAIPEHVDADKVEAQLKDGVLEVRLPKVQPAEPAGKKIEIKAS